jgi:hypothetical protein
MALVATALLAAPASTGQSLAEVAAKERERRAEVAKSGSPARVISERELEEAPGDALSIAGTPLEADSPDPGAEVALSGREGARAKLDAKQIRELREEWGRIWEEQMRQAELELEKARDDRYQCRSAERYFFVPIAVDCEGVDLRLASAEARLRKIKRNRYRWELLLPESPGP